MKHQRNVSTQFQLDIITREQFFSCKPEDTIHSMGQREQYINKGSCMIKQLNALSMG